MSEVGVNALNTYDPAMRVGPRWLQFRERKELNRGLSMTDSVLVSEFNEEMLNIYRRALSEAHYKATRFLSMLNEHGGLETARLLIHLSSVSEGYAALWERNRLNLTVEAVIHDNPKWHALFSEEELAICKRRLTDYRYFG